MTPAEFASSGLWVSNHLNVATYVSVASLPTEIANPATHAATLFNPTHLDFDEYLDYAERLGAVGAILTAKHHDGFCLWPSAVTQSGQQRTIAQTTWYQKNGGRNVLLEWVNKTRARGLRVGYYFSPWDEYKEFLNGGTPALVGSGAYTTWNVSQLQEILNSAVYGSIDFILLDGWGNTWTSTGPSFTDVVYQTVVDAIRAAQPGIVICVNDHEDGSEATLHGDVSLWERPADGEPTQGAITNFLAGALWNTTQKKVSDANASAWFDHTDGDTLVASDANQAIGRRYRMDRLTSPRVATILNYSSYPDGRLAADTKVMLAELTRPVGTLIGRDNFSLGVAETAGVALQSHTSLEGVTWSKDFGADAIVDPYGILRINDNVNGGSYVYNSSPANADYRAELDFKFLTVPSAFVISVRMRATDSTHDNRLKADWNGTTRTIALQRHNAGLVNLQSFSTVAADNPAVGKLFRIAVEKIGNELRGELWIDHTGTGNSYMLWGKLFNTETIITSIGKPGLYIFGLGSATTGLQVTDFRVTTKDATAPSAPTMLAPEARSDGILLRWTGAPADLWKYKIERSTDGATFSFLGNATTSEFFDTSAAAGVGYQYRVKALDLSFNNGAASNVVAGSLSEEITSLDFNEEDRARMEALVPFVLASQTGGITIESTTSYLVPFTWSGFAPNVPLFVGDDVVFYDESNNRQPSRRRITSTAIVSGVALRIVVDAAPDFTVATNDSLAIVRAASYLGQLSEEIATSGANQRPVNQTAVPLARTVVLKHTDDGLVGESPITLKQSASGRMLAVDFRNDLSTNGRVATIVSVEVVSGTASGITLEADLDNRAYYGVDRSQAKFLATPLLVGEYVLAVEVTYDPADGGGNIGFVTLIVT